MRLWRWVLRVLDLMAGIPREEVHILAPPRVVPDMVDTIIFLDPASNPLQILMQSSKNRRLWIRAPGVEPKLERAEYTRWMEDEEIWYERLW